MNISFIVACYNEEANVIGAIEKVHQAATDLALTHEILIFDDCSKDGTSRVVNEYIQNFPDVPVKLFRNEENKGVAYNFVEGAFQGRGEYCRLICGDNIEPLETHMTILKDIGKSDMIIPYYKVIKGRGLLRHIISKGFTTVVNLISGFSLQYYNGCPILKRMDVMRWHVEATGLGYQAELIIRLLRQGRSYIEVAVEGDDREGSVSFRLRNVLSVFHTIVKIILARSKIVLLR